MMTMTTETLPKKILTVAAGKPEGTPVTATEFLHLGSRAAIDQALSRLTKSGLLLRAARGLYLAPIKGRFGVRSPELSKVVEAMARQSGETVVPNEAASANALGLTTQVPVRQVYLTSGKSRRLKVGAQIVELKHAPQWKLSIGNRPAGQALRAIFWAGEKNAHTVVSQLKKRLPQAQLVELASASTHYMPTWAKDEIVAMNAHG